MSYWYREASCTNEGCKVIASWLGCPAKRRCDRRLSLQNLSGVFSSKSGSLELENSYVVDG